MKMTFIRFTLLLVILAFSAASPIRSEKPGAVYIPIFIDDLAELDNPLRDGSPVAYYFGRTEPRLRKRDTLETDADDLETAAGTNALRPLFVYRQQVAYRQRLREAVRRGFRF